MRDALRIALSGRDDVTLEPILSFLARHITDARFGEMASEVAGVIIGLSLFTVKDNKAHRHYSGMQISILHCWGKHRLSTR